MNLNKLSKEIYQANKAKGWWDDADRCFFINLLLCISEAIEATEGERRDLQDNHLPHLKSGVVELADCSVRILDLLGRYEYEIAPYSDEHDFEKQDNIFLYHLELIAMIVEIKKPLGYMEQSGFYHEDGKYVYKRDLYKDRYRKDNSYDVLVSLQECLHYIIFICNEMGYDLFDAIEQKRAFNAQRKDHTRESRALANGKKI